MRAMVRRPRRRQLIAYAKIPGFCRGFSTGPTQATPAQDVSSQCSRFARPRVAALRRRASPCVADAADGSVRWHMKRNCSIAPRQLLGVYLSLCVVAWASAACSGPGAPCVLPFAGAELLAARRRARRLRPPCGRPREHDAAAGAAVGRLHRSAGATEQVDFPRRLGAGRAGASRRLADRAVGRGPAHRRRPVRAPRAAPRPGRRAARGAAPDDARSRPPERQTTRRILETWHHR